MWHRSLLSTLKEAKERGLCLYGAGFWGEIAYKLFTKMGVNPLCFCDDDTNKWGMNYQGLKIYSLEDAVKIYPNAIYIVCVNNTRRRGEWNHTEYFNMMHSLEKCGVYDINSELRIKMYVYLLDIDDYSSLSQKKEQDMFEIKDIQNAIIFNHMSSSGSFYFEQLLDGNPNILCMPYSSVTFYNVYEYRLKYLEGEELLLEMMAQMLGYFHSKYEEEYCIRENIFGGWCVDEQGEFIYDVLLEPEEFFGYLKNALGMESRLKSFGHMMKVYTVAYNNCLGRRKKRGEVYWLFYHMHKPDYDITKMESIFMKSEFKRIENLMLIREPIRHCHSWIKTLVIEYQQNPVLTKNETFIHMLENEFGKRVQKKAGYEMKVIRFEDLKIQTEAILKKICEYLEIPFVDTMLDTTLNGYKIYFPKPTQEGMTYITGNDKSPIEPIDYSQILTVWDIARLNMICSKFKKAYGYANDVPEFTEFSHEMLEKLLERDFKFATITQNLIDEECKEEDKYDVNKYIKQLYKDYMYNYQDSIEYYDYFRV